MNTEQSNNNSTFSSAHQKLVICEKPSVAQTIAAVLGARERGDGCVAGNGWIVTWCVGHLVELAQAAAGVTLPRCTCRQAGRHQAGNIIVLRASLRPICCQPYVQPQAADAFAVPQQEAQQRLGARYRGRPLELHIQLAEQR